RATGRDGLPGRDRELQWLVEGPGLVTLPAPGPGGTVAALSAARARLAAAPGGTDRGGPGPPGVPRGLAAEPQDTTARPARLPGAQGPSQSITDPGGGLPAAQPALPGLIGVFGIYWHLSAYAQSGVRDPLA